MDSWSWMSLATPLAVAVSCAVVAVATLLAVRDRRPSTAMVVLRWFGYLVLAAGAANLAEVVPWSELPTWFHTLISAILLIGVGAVSLTLVRLLPRAATFQDRHHLHAASRELRQSKQRFQRAIDSSCGGLWEWNFEDNTAWYSPRFRELLGYSQEQEFPDEIASWKSAIHVDDRQHIFGAFDVHLQRSQGSIQVEHRLQTKAGEYRWFTVRGKAISNPDGRPYMFAGSILDIHDQKQAEEAVRQRDQYLVQKQKMEALGELAGGAAHEFNNLLQAISGQIQFAERELPDGSAAKDDLEIAAQLIDQSASFTRQLLDFSRRQPKVLTPVDLNRLVTSLATMVRPLIGPEIELDLRLGTEIAPVLAEESSLQQALLNLCINARDAMPAGGRLVIRTCGAELRNEDLIRFPDAKQGEYVLVSVTDNGNGIDKKIKDRIFEPFFTTKKVGEGTGLGLAVAYRVVKECHGIIDVETALGHGSTFALWLPVTHEPAHPPTRHKPTLHVAQTHIPATILFADDDECIRRSTAQLLREHGHRVLTAVDGLEAVSLFTEHWAEVDLALLDIVMPGLTGDAVMLQLRNHRPDLPVVFCTGYASPQIDTSIINNLDTWLISKPFKSEHLLQQLDEALISPPSGQFSMS